MILILPGERSHAALEACLILARQLAAHGYPACIDAAMLPDDLTRGQKYEAAIFALDPFDAPPDQILLIAAQRLAQDTLDRLRHLGQGPDAPAVAVLGRFADRASRIAAQSKVAYAVGREPLVVDLDDLSGLPVAAELLEPGFCTIASPAPRQAGALTLAINAPTEALATAPLFPALSVLRHQPGLRMIVVPAAGGRDRLRDGPAAILPLMDPADLPPAALAQTVDILALFGPADGDDRLTALVMAMIGLGKPVIDCTGTQSFCASGAPVLGGPDDPAALGPYLDRMVLPNLADISRFVSTTPWRDRHAFARLATALGLPPPPEGDAPQPPPQTLFLPTNGVGLGHAQRCGLIAARMSGDVPARFAAFPSCVPLIQDHGFDCLPLVQKSPDHADPFANDVLNYRRLSRHLRRGDRLVFDGGFLFDSVFRLIAEKDLRAIWIRRGLWQAGQIEDHKRLHRVREALFETIIQPLEAFEELNEPITYGSPVRAVGPIVQDSPLPPADAAALRDRLARRFGRAFAELTVTMLGAGHAADRSAQMQALCSIFERRADCLHLVVIWPGAAIPPGLFGWKNTRVVQTRRALALAQAADMVVSAAGYNSFHEILYHAVPSILIPQMSPFMDDQRRRAQAAAERDLAAAIEPQDLLRLEREVAVFLDDGKAGDIRSRLGTLSLPARGTSAAAALIGGVDR